MKLSHFMSIVFLTVTGCLPALAQISPELDEESLMGLRHPRRIVVVCGCAAVSNPFFGYQAFAQGTNIETGRIVWSRALSSTFLGPNAQRDCDVFAAQQIATNPLCR